MPLPLRKSFQRKSGERGGNARSSGLGRLGRSSGLARSLELRLSGLTVAVLLLLFVAVLGWSFFMGFMVGRGQSPEQRVEELADILPLPESGPADMLAEAEVSPRSNEDGIQDGISGAAAPAPQAVATDTLPGSDVLNGALNRDTTAASAANTGSAPASSQPTAETGPQPAELPFARPSGEGLAAWGITPASGPKHGPKHGQGQSPPRTPDQPRNAAPQTSPWQEGPAARTQEARFDYIFQTAAFKSRDEAEALCQRLEATGMRCRIRPGGKFWLVMVHLRGSQREADNLVEELRRMRLGKPLQRSKQAVPSRGGATAR